MRPPTTTCAIWAEVLAIAFAQLTLAQTPTPCDIKSIFTDPTQPAVSPEIPRANQHIQLVHGSAKQRHDLEVQDFRVALIQAGNKNPMPFS